MFRMLFAICVAGVLACAAVPAPALEGVWDEAPGVVTYYNDEGRLVTKQFRYYLTTKHAFFHLETASHEMRLHIRHPKRIELYGDGNPIRVTLRDGDILEGEVQRSFVFELTGLDTFSFRSAAPGTGRVETFTVPSEAVQSLAFR